jgi:MFS family permease
MMMRIDDHASDLRLCNGAHLARVGPTVKRSRAIAAVAMLIGAAFLGSTLVTPIYSLYEHAFGFSKITLTLIYSVYVVGNLLALFFFGRLSDRIGRKNVGLAAMGLAIGSALLFLFADGTAWLYAGRALGGFAVGIASGTGTAWLAELYGADRRPEATVMATASNMTGIAIGPLIGGLLAQFAPDPLRLPFVVNVLIIIVVGILIAVWPPETVRDRATSMREIDFRPRIGVPKNIRARFIAPAVSAFAIFALGGFYFALIPSVLRESLHNPSSAIAGGIVFEMAAIMVVVIVSTRALESYIAMFAALAGLIPAVGLLVTAQFMSSMPLLLIASALVGVVFGLGYRGGLQVVNEIAPDDRRAEVASSYFLACFSGNSIPVIGVGILSTIYGLDIASSALAVMVAVLAIFAIVVGLRTSRG